MDESPKHCTEWKKPDLKEHAAYDSDYVSSRAGKTNP